jgi:hypothetical protein
MHADDLTKPLMPTPTKRRRGIVLSFVAAASGVLSGLVILFGAAPDRGKPLSPAPLPAQPPLIGSVQQTAAVPVPAPAIPTGKTITVIDSQTGARREVVIPASANDQSEDGNPALRSDATTAARTDTAGTRGRAKSKRH